MVILTEGNTAYIVNVDVVIDGNVHGVGVDNVAVGVAVADDGEASSSSSLLIWGLMWIAWDLEGSPFLWLTSLLVSQCSHTKKFPPLYKTQNADHKVILIEGRGQDRNSLFERRSLEVNQNVN